MNRNHTSTLPIALTMGDAAGIGPEIIIKTLAESAQTDQLLVYGDENILRQTAIRLGMPNLTIPIRTCCPPLPPITMGKAQAAAGEGAYQFLRQAIEDCMSNKASAIVTAPLHKVSLKMAGYDFPGHTEILAALTHTPDVAMMLVNEELRIILVTIHVALSKVPQIINFEQECRIIRLAQQACLQMGITDPRIAVAGLNPHAGEEGRFGEEEIHIITPAIEAMRRQGINVSGPYPGDTIFMRARQGDFDIVIAQYHDQGLIPIKYLGIDEGVNVTVGLPFIRTSVDHGTAFDIAGKGIADPRSLQAAIRTALKMR